MSLHRGVDGPDPVRADPVGRLAGPAEHRDARSAWILATGTLACPRCDAPVDPGGPLAPSDPLRCPYCAHGGPVRDFLSLAAPSRPARVELRVVRRGSRLRP